MSKEIIVPKARYPLPDDYPAHFPRPEAVYKALIRANEKRKECGEDEIDYSDPEELTKEVQNIYDVGYSDADEVGLYVFENYF